MTNNTNKFSAFVDSELKVTASDDLDVSKELAAEKMTDKTLEELLEANEQDDPKE